MRAVGGRLFRWTRGVVRGNRRAEIYRRVLAEPCSRTYLETALREARASVPFYQTKEYECLDEGYLDRAPVLTKEVIRRSFDRLVRRGATRDECRLNTSGGSTGAPIVICQDSLYKDWAVATQQYFLRQFLGIDYECVAKVILWGSERDLLGQTDGWVARLRNFLTQTTYINSFRLSVADLRAAAKRIVEVRPVLIVGYAGSLHTLAQFIVMEGTRVPRPRCIYSSAEVLTGSMRATIERAFSAPVYDFYGSREVGPIAGECRYGALHVFSFHNHVEIVDESGKEVMEGEEGRVLVTTLHNSVMPLVRYEIGDLATKGEPCPCGQMLPTLGRIVGRTTDHFVTADGSRVHGEFFTHLFYFRSWVSQFQVIQKAVDRIAVIYVGTDEPPKADQSEIEEKVRHVMGRACEVEWRRVEYIPRTPQGKFRYTRSELAV